MRIFGIILGAVAIILSGFALRDTLKKRVKLLEKLIYETEKLKKSVLIHKKPIGEITKTLTLPPFSDEYKADKKAEPAFLVVSDFLYSLKECRSDEAALISDVLASLREIRNKAENELLEKGTMYIKLSVCLGLLFVVIVI